GAENEGLAVEKYRIPVIQDRDAMRSHPHVLRAPIKMTDDDAAGRRSHDCEGGARDLVDPFGALRGCLEVEQDIMRARPDALGQQPMRQALDVPAGLR